MNTNSRPQTSFVLASVSVLKILFEKSTFIYTYFTHAIEHTNCFVIETLKYNKSIFAISNLILFVDDLHGRYYNEVLAKVTRAALQLRNNLHRAKYNAERTAVCSPDSALNFVERCLLIQFQMLNTTGKCINRRIIFCNSAWASCTRLHFFRYFFSRPLSGASELQSSESPQVVLILVWYPK